MEKPIKRSIEDLKRIDFVDFLFETYEPKKNSAGEFFYNGLDYLTNEMSHMSSETEKEFIEEHGFAAVGFLELLRIQMAKTSGFGIRINNKDLQKALAALSIDYGVDIAEMKKYYEQLVDAGMIIVITGSNGDQYATTIQQVFNWEYKMWTRWTNNQYQKKKRGAAESKEVPTEPATDLFDFTDFNVSSEDVDAIF